MFNALVLSYSRLPLAMARDGMLPKVFGKVTRKRDPLGGDSGMRQLLGALPGNWVQETGYAYHALWRELDA